MLKKKVLTFEWFLVVFFVIQIVWNEHFSPKSAWIIFALLLLLKHFLEGFRLNIFVFPLTQALFTIIDNQAIKVFLLLVPLFAVYYFPVFRFPRAMGLFFAAYKVLKLRNIEISVYYPTSALSEPVPLTPSKKAWMRFHKILKAEGSKVPGLIFRLGLSFLDHLELPVQFESRIVSKQHLTHGRKFPIILFSHGIACNRNMYTSFMREWASNGYIVFSVDHEEAIDFPSNFSTQELNAFRLNQVKKRKEALSKVLDYIVKPENFQDLFEDSGIEIDLTKISIVGQSFGGAAAVYTALNDKRVNGVCILLDPALDCIYEETKGKSLGLPTLIIRTHSTEGSFRGGRDNKEMMIALINDNKESSKQSMCCMFEKSSHLSQTDLVLHLPRECVLFKVLPNISDIEEALLVNNRLTQMYLDTMLHEKDPYGMAPNVDIVLKKFTAFTKRAGKKNRLLVDKLK